MISGIPEKSLAMYFQPEIVAAFTKRQENAKFFQLAEMIDRLVGVASRNFTGPLRAAHLCGSAHTDQLHDLFARLLRVPGSRMDWVDFSPAMLDMARGYVDDDRYRARFQVLNFVEGGPLEYLNGLSDGTLDLAIMKYTFDYFPRLDDLWQALGRKLKIGGVLVATLSSFGPTLKSGSSNARFMYRGAEFPEGETRTLQDGDEIGIKFLKEFRNLSAGYLEGAETFKYYHSSASIEKLALANGFEIFIGDWKDYLISSKAGDGGGVAISQNILVATKK